MTGFRSALPTDRCTVRPLAWAKPSLMATFWVTPGSGGLPRRMYSRASGSSPACAIDTIRAETGGARPRADPDHVPDDAGLDHGHARDLAQLGNHGERRALQFTNTCGKRAVA